MMNQLRMPSRRTLAATTLCSLLITVANGFTVPISSTNYAVHRQTSTQISASTDDDSNNQEADRLLEQAAKLRAEIAEMEGKSVRQVEDEARDKKTQEQEFQTQLLEERAKSKPNAIDSGKFLQVPSTVDEMIRQASRAIEDAYKDGIDRQTVRLALVKTDQSFLELEQWPGGPQEMYREAAKPLTKELLRSVSTENVDLKLPPEIQDQDIWDFDGSALITAQAKSGPEHDVQALVFANTDTKYTNDIETISKSMNNRLFLLVNPFWRNVDSWGFNLLAPNAKNRAQKVIFDNDNFQETYSFQRLSVRGEMCVALKVYPYDWQLFAYREDEYSGQEFAIRLGSTAEEPTTEQFTELINARPEFKETRNMRQMKKLF